MHWDGRVKKFSERIEADKSNMGFPSKNPRNEAEFWINHSRDNFRLIMLRYSPSHHAALLVVFVQRLYTELERKPGEELWWDVYGNPRRHPLENGSYFGRLHNQGQHGGGVDVVVDHQHTPAVAGGCHAESGVGRHAQARCVPQPLAARKNFIYIVYIVYLKLI